MFESSHRHRTVCAVVLAVVLLLSLVPAGLALAQAMAPFRVMGHQCDKAGAVTALAIQVDAPGPVILQWDNGKVCGKSI